MSHANAAVAIGFVLFAASATAQDAHESTTVTRTRAELPARFAAPLPTSPAAMRAWFRGDPAFPPESNAADALASGDAAMFERVRAAATRVAADDVDAWADLVHAWLRPTTVTPAFCTRARVVLAGPPSTFRAALSVPFAGSCAGAADRALIVRPDTPDAAVLAWYGADREQAPIEPMPFDERLVAIARESAGVGGESLAGAVRTLALRPEPEAGAALVAIHAGIDDPRRAMAFAESMRWSRDPRVQAVAVASCRADPNNRSDCTRPYGDPNAPRNEPPRAQPELAARLRAAGFAHVPDAAPPTETGIAAIDLLVAGGHAYAFDVEAADFPVHHDAVLRRLAALVAPALDGVVFEEVAPEDSGDFTDYALRAYVDGVLLETKARNTGDWYDLPAILRLLDATLLQRRSEARLVALGTRSQVAAILAGSAANIEAVLRSGVVRAADPRAAATLGREFEERVNRSIQDRDTGPSMRRRK